MTEKMETYPNFKTEQGSPKNTDFNDKFSQDLGAEEYTQNN